MSAVYPSDEPEDEENPNDIIESIIDRIIGYGNNRGEMNGDN